MPWFVQLMVNKMPPATVSLIWDMFLIKDMRQLFRAILTAISHVHDMCLSLDRWDEVLLTIQGFIASDLTPEMLLNSLEPPIPYDVFQASRERNRWNEI